MSEIQYKIICAYDENGDRKEMYGIPQYFKTRREMVEACELYKNKYTGFKSFFTKKTEYEDIE